MEIIMLEDNTRKPYENPYMDIRIRPNISKNGFVGIIFT
jgi:hypothetical protein